MTQNKKPIALINDAENAKNKDKDDWQLEMSHDFWQMIEDRRHCPTVSLAEAEAILFVDEA